MSQIDNAVNNVCMLMGKMLAEKQAQVEALAAALEQEKAKHETVDGDKKPDTELSGTDN